MQTPMHLLQHCLLNDQVLTVLAVTAADEYMFTLKKEIMPTTRHKAVNKTKNRSRMLSIVNEAKKIRKASPNKKWTTCIKEASKKLFK